MEQTIINKIKEIYPINGLHKTAKLLNISTYKLRKIIIKYDLKKKRRVDIENFKNINKKEVAYFLGFFWADGFFHKDEVVIEIKASDGNDIKSVLNTFGSWRTENRQRKLNEKIFNQFKIVVNDKYIKDFLIEHDYGEKSILTPTKILEKIPNELKSYFYRGYIDGDGCFCSKNNRSYFSITGNIKQNWKEFEMLFNSLGIKCKITCKERNIGNSSYVVISNKKDIIKFGNYIYGESDHIYDNIGLKRKFIIYKEIKNRPISKYSNVK